MKLPYCLERLIGVCVAPYAGAWIEIIAYLKLTTLECVAPYAGAWIEMICATCARGGLSGRPLRGGVD